MKFFQPNIDNPPYAMMTESNQITFRVMGFGTFSRQVKTVATLAIVFGILFALMGITQALKSGQWFVPLAFIIFGLVDLSVGIRMWFVGTGITQAQQYRLEHQGIHPKDTLYTYNSSTQTLNKTKHDTAEVLVQGSAPAYRVRKTASHGGFAGYLFTLVWPTSSAIVMLGEDEDEKGKIEQALQAVGIQLAT